MLQNVVTVLTRQKSFHSSDLNSIKVNDLKMNVLFALYYVFNDGVCLCALYNIYFFDLDEIRYNLFKCISS